MFGLLKAKNPYEQAAHKVYATLIKRACRKTFYKDFSVEDSFEGRFECLCVHIFMVMHVVLERKGDEAFNQALFDIMFTDMDQALRQTGKGDMGVPKHMRRMMKGFNGRMNVYHETYNDKQAFEKAVQRNVYGAAENPPIKKMVAYLRENLSAIMEQDLEVVMNGKVALCPIGKKGNK